MLYNWDAVQFALALREFDVAKHQPHPPGYLLYVALGRLLNASLSDPNMAYVTLAMLFSAATTFTVYWLARALYDRVTAAAAAALLAVSPLFWFYGSVGLTYAGEAFGAVLVAWFAWGALQGKPRQLYAGALALGLVGGIRPSVLVLLFPLWLACGINSALASPISSPTAPRHRLSSNSNSALASPISSPTAPRHRLSSNSNSALASGRPMAAAQLEQRDIRRPGRIGLGLLVMGGAVLTWLLPMLWLTGGLEAYLRASSQLYGSVVLPTSVLGGSLDVTLAQARYVLGSVVIGLGPLALAALAIPLYLRRVGWGRPDWFLATWVVPPAAFYMLVHFGQAGYVLTFLPALVILLSRVLVEAVAAGSERLRRPNWRWGLTATALLPLCLVSTGFFVSARPVPREFNKRTGEAWVWRAKDEAHDWIMSRTAAALREHEAVIRTYLDTIRAVYDPSDTALVTELGNRRSYPWLRHAMFYMPEYAIYQLQVGEPPRGFYAPQSSATMILTPSSTIEVPRRVRQLVWFVDHWDPKEPRPPGLLEVQLPYGRYLYVLPLGRGRVEYAGYTFVRLPR
jgi:transmembrane protein TMEM260 (protein O-mannosyltransferase)